MNSNANKCPLCGQDNQCAIARAEKPEKVDCWCMSVGIPSILVDAVPEKEKGQSCICQACVNQHQK